MDGIVTRLSHRDACLCLLLSSCAGSLPVAQKAEDWPGDGIVVAALPPPALPEEVPPLPETQAGLVWTDGCWEWTMGRWVWLRGGWVDPPQDGAHFRGKIVVDANGSLLWKPCSWIANGKQLGLIEPVVAARYPASSRSVAR